MTNPQVDEPEPGYTPVPAALLVGECDHGGEDVYAVVYCADCGLDERPAGEGE